MISLYGSLARKVKKKYPHIDPKNIPCVVKSAGEAIRALESQIPGFKSMIRRKGYYKVVRGDNVEDNSKSLPKEQLQMKFGDNHWHIMPVAAGAGGKGGILMTVLGAVLIVVGIVVNIYYPGMGTPIIMAGVGMMAGGLSMMLSPVPEMPKSEREDTPSYLFNGALNIDEPGVTVPCAYGECFVGSVVVSFGVKVEDYN
jgi:predicted phage tail protein